MMFLVQLVLNPIWLQTSWMVFGNFIIFTVCGLFFKKIGLLNLWFVYLIGHMNHRFYSISAYFIVLLFCWHEISLICISLDPKNSFSHWFLMYLNYSLKTGLY